MTVLVSVMAWVSISASRESASGNGVWLVLPGLRGFSINFNVGNDLHTGSCRV
jgi:hypothetical protein